MVPGPLGLVGLGSTVTLPSHELRRLVKAAGGDAGRLAALVSARLGGEPLQYLEGTAAFGPLELVVDHRVLIPRPETEQLWELAVRLMAAPRVIVDLCTGSGALALALKRSFPEARVLATELSVGAADVARLNAARLGLSVEVLEGDLFGPLPAEVEGYVDLLVSNPPYVADEEWQVLPDDVKREPRLALVAGPLGTETLARIAEAADRWLAPGGAFVCEIGETQNAVALRVFSATSDDVHIRHDLTGRPRFIVGRRRQIRAVPTGSPNGRDSAQS